MRTKLYHHKTDGGAEYLTDTFIAWKHNGKRGKEGRVTSDTKICIRLDGHPELIANRSMDELVANAKALLFAIEPNRGDLSRNQRQAIDNMRAVIERAKNEN